jgi:DMSO/TMAO reductase YedYZ heme-binding membrane subunit
VHYFWNVRGEQPTPLIAIGMVVLLLAARLPAVARRLSALRT